MHARNKVEVLIVGAGPVGLYAALRLAERGVRVEVVDKESQTTMHSYSCVLHPSTLEMLDQAGLAEELIQLGHRIETLGFYDQGGQRAQIRFDRLGGRHAFALTVSQADFEDLLERRLARLYGIPVLWNHRFAKLALGQDKVRAAVDELEMSAKGYVIPDFDWVVRKSHEYEVDFIIGADGHHSPVRQALGIQIEALGNAETFKFIEFETHADPGAEAKVIIADGTVNALWPLAPHRVRWTLGIIDSNGRQSDPDKERSHIQIDEPAADAACLTALLDLIERRAPWRKESVREICWQAQAGFTPSLVRNYGKSRVWLAGDAAHQADPIGSHSVNAGLREGEELARCLWTVLRAGGSSNLLDHYDYKHRQAWRQLQGLNQELNQKPGIDCSHWTEQHQRRITRSIPAAREHCEMLLEQVGLICRHAELASA